MYGGHDTDVEVLVDGAPKPNATQHGGKEDSTVQEKETPLSTTRATNVLGDIGRGYFKTGHNHGR